MISATLEIDSDKLKIEMVLVEALKRLQDAYPTDRLRAIALSSDPCYGRVTIAFDTTKHGELDENPAEWNHYVFAEYNNKDWERVYFDKQVSTIQIRRNCGSTIFSAGDGDQKFSRPFFEMLIDALYTVLHQYELPDLERSEELLAGVVIGHEDLTFYFNDSSWGPSRPGNPSNMHGDSCLLPADLGRLA